MLGTNKYFAQAPNLVSARQCFGGACLPHLFANCGDKSQALARRAGKYMRVKNLPRICTSIEFTSH